MPRYKLMSYIPCEDDEHEIGGQRKNTKKEIERWVTDNVNACGLDWRDGYTIKFRTSKAVYVWKWIKDDRVVK